MIGLSEIKDASQIVASLGATIGGLVAAFKAIHEIRENRRWKMAEAAKNLVDELFSDDLAYNAAIMVDYDGRKFKIGDKTRAIDKKFVIESLRTDRDSFSEDEKYVRDCFDHLFYFIRRIAQAEASGLIKAADVRESLKYPVGKLLEHGPNVQTYMTTYGFDLAAQFIRANFKAESDRP